MRTTTFLQVGLRAQTDGSLGEASFAYLYLVESNPIKTYECTELRCTIKRELIKGTIRVPQALLVNTDEERRKAMTNGERIGEVTHYYNKISVAVLKLTQDLVVCMSAEDVYRIPDCQVLGQFQNRDADLVIVMGHLTDAFSVGHRLSPLLVGVDQQRLGNSNCPFILTPS